MKLIKLSLAAALVATVSFAQEVNSDVEMSANVAMTSNYVWRGMTQSDNSPAIQGGFDLGYKGAYLGVWGSNVNFASDVSMEIDIYAGYAGEISGLGYDVGFIQFAYPNDSDALNFGEAYLGLSYDFGAMAVSATYSVGVSTADAEDIPDNIEVGLSIPLPSDISLDATYGDYDTYSPYYSVGVSKSFGKFDFTVAYSDATDLDGSDNIVATVGTSF